MSLPTTQKTADPDTAFLDVLVVGAGFAGLYALHKFRELGFTVRLFEAGGGVGGTWFWNRYPGARCDCQSQVYSYTFDERLQREWQWSERYATQPEILRYLNFVADRLALRQDIQFDSRVTAAVFDERRHLWKVTTGQGDAVEARHLLLATGALSISRKPAIPGSDRFRGESYHTSDWPEGTVNFGGKRVGVIGTGSSGVQVIPLIAQEAARLTVFQRTPAYVAPARNTPLTETERQRFLANLSGVRQALRAGKLVGNGDLIIADNLPPTQPSAGDFTPAQCEAMLEARWQVGGMSILHAFADVFRDMQANARLGNFVQAKIRSLVEDPAKAEQLVPSMYPILSKRLCVGTDYFETFNRENVALVDIRKTPIEEITERGLRTSQARFDLDVLVFATGFDALTGSLLQMNITGRDGLSLKEAWSHGPHSYLGIMIAGFPNLFTLNGPGSPGILGNNVVGIEHHVEWVADLLCYARELRLTSVEARADADTEWTQHLRQVAEGHILARGDGWYVKKDIPGQKGVFVPYVGTLSDYCQLCDEVARHAYREIRFLPPSELTREGEDKHCANA
jgi:cation diffusion facilitator CzcD-associated flavoprotein CzcO